MILNLLLNQLFAYLGQEQIMVSLTSAFLVRNSEILSKIHKIIKYIFIQKEI